MDFAVENHDYTHNKKNCPKIARMMQKIQKKFQAVTPANEGAVNFYVLFPRGKIP